MDKRAYILSSILVLLFVGALLTAPHSPSTLRQVVSDRFPQDAERRDNSETRARRIRQALEVRNKALGPELMPQATGMGDISTSNLDTQIVAYSDWVAQPWVRTVCEIGFAIGTSTIVYLESNPDVRVISFDTLTWNTKALEFVRGRYGHHRITMVTGLSEETLPASQGVYGKLCDIISIDGMHDKTVLADLRNFQPMANPERHVILADDCVPHAVFERLRAKKPNFNYFPDVWESWTKLDSEGFLRAHKYIVHGGEDDGGSEVFGFVKGWCEGEYNLNEK
jgi:hypothetical protein